MSSETDDQPPKSFPTARESRLLFSSPLFEKGWVWLAGAGPGDPSLLTLQLYDALGKADFIVYDFLVSEAILALVPSSVERLYAGKRGGKPSPSQRDITETLITSARAGRRVLRLKGGDPFLFARGGEEALALANAGIPFRVLPGISAAPAALAYAGIPLTHRDYNSSITFLTGHDLTGALPRKIRWNMLAGSAEVLVFYMVMKHIATIVRKLLAAGRDPQEPVAFIRNATLPDQTIAVGVLKDAVDTAKRFSPPVVFVVGSVVGLHEQLAWWSPPSEFPRSRGKS